MPDQTTDIQVRAERFRKVIHAYMHGDRGKLSGFVIDLSRTGCLLTLRGWQWEVGDDGSDYQNTSLRVASHFGDGIRIELLEAGRTIDAEAVRFSEADVDGKKLICIGCRFREPLTSDLVASLTIQPSNQSDAPSAGEPHKPSKRIIMHAPGSLAGGSLPLLPDGEADNARDLLRLMAERGASDLHVCGDSIARIRINGELIPVSKRIVTPDEAACYVSELLTEEELARFENEWDLDFGYSAEGIGRFRINALRARGEVALTIRRVPDVVPSFEDLGLVPVCTKIAELTEGLVVVTGPGGSGKTATLAAMLRHINETRACHIVTLEDPIEYVHQEQQARITQREIGKDTRNFNDALRRALRHDPDVLLVGELRDPETIALALTAAENGHLVFGTLHTTSASATVERLLDIFPAEKHEQIQLQLANTLRAVCAQVLLPTIDGGQVIAQEILLATADVRNLIREGKVSQITHAMQTTGRHDMQTLEEAISELVSNGTVDLKAARSRANNAAMIHKHAPQQRPAR